MQANQTAQSRTDPLARQVGRFLVVAGELALIVLAIHLFQIESHRPLRAVMALALGGFLVHAWLPLRYRLPFFCLLSLASVVVLLGWRDGAWVLGLGGALLGLCHLPGPLWLRVLLLVVAGGILAAWRADSSAPFWPVLGSMFMFRLLVYLYDLRHERCRPPLSLALAYFFPLPNVCFTLFPVIDFKTFRQTYYAEEPYALYQTGVEWIARGLCHLLLYRLVKYYLLPAPHELRDLPHLALFLAANYALYLRVSGWFHLITGVLHLFGFGLPRTHHNYFLASSCSDVWKRINIYWKDFMTKLFFFPAFFTLRGWGTRTALAVAGVWVFVATWLLHSYQVFWLLGELPLRGNEAGLWLVAGVLVAVNLQFDLNRAAQASRTSPSALGSAVWLSLRVVGMFVLVSFFWACWTIPDFLSRLRVLSAASSGTAAGVLVVAVVVLGAVAVGVLAQLVRERLLRHGLLPLPASFGRSAVIQTGTLLALVAAGLPQVGAVLGPRTADWLSTMRSDSLTPVEAGQVVRGYYEEIADTRVQATPLLGQPRRGAQPPGVHYTELTRPTDDLLERELIPGWSGELAGARLRINGFGMRDREGIELKKPPNTCRLAWVGSSVVMGYGVGDEDVFPRLLQDRLNAGRTDGVRYESLNFGAGMCYAIHRHVLIDRKVWRFEPDAIYYVAHQDELLGPVRHLAKLVARKNELPYPCLGNVLRQAKITPDMSWGETEARLEPFAREIVLGIYKNLVAECRRRSVLPVWVYLPMPGIADAPVRMAELVDLATQAGFVVLDLTRWADGFAASDIKLSATDHHANARGHRLIAERLEAVLRERPEALPPFARRGP
jgi:hypothetical protein